MLSYSYKVGVVDCLNVSRSMVVSWRRNCRTFTYTYYVTLLVCCTYAVHVIRIRFDCGINTRCLASRPVLNPPLFRQSLVEPRRTTILPTHFWCCDRYVGYIVIPRYIYGAVTGTSAILSYPATFMVLW